MMGFFGRIKEWFLGKGERKEEKRQEFKESPEPIYKPMEVMKVSDDIVDRDIEQGFSQKKAGKKKAPKRVKKKSAKKAKKKAKPKKKRK